MKSSKLFTIQINADNLTAVTKKAINTWVAALGDRVRFRIVAKGGDTKQPDITVGWGTTDRSQSPDRIAQCTSYMGRNDNGSQHRRSVIILDTRNTWKITWGQRWIWGQGTEDALAAVLHEIGHALGFPHSNVYSDVMNASCGTTVISNYEAKLLCEFWDKYHS